jgi:hypothetical protein
VCVLGRGGGWREGGGRAQQRINHLHTATLEGGGGGEGVLGGGGGGGQGAALYNGMIMGSVHYMQGSITCTLSPCVCVWGGGMMVCWGEGAGEAGSLPPPPTHKQTHLYGQTAHACIVSRLQARQQSLVLCTGHVVAIGQAHAASQGQAAGGQVKQHKAIARTTWGSHGVTSGEGGLTQS